MSEIAYMFTYSVEDINNAVRKTNALLRGANAIRHVVHDFKQVIEKPNLQRIMWTMVQLIRAYRALRRIYRLTIAEAQVASTLTGLVRRIVVPEKPKPPGIPPPPPTDLGTLSIRVSAFRENLPMALEGVDLTDLPEETMARLQRVFEEDAEGTVADAKTILNEQIASYTSKYSPAGRETSGFLESSIGWMSEVLGTRIYADAPYAWWVERGQRTFPGHWYMTGAVDLARQRLPDKIRAELNQLVYEDKAAAKTGAAMRTLFRG